MHYNTRYITPQQKMVEIILLGHIGILSSIIQIILCILLEHQNYLQHIFIHLSLLIMSRKYLLLCPAYWTQWEQHGELRSPCNSGVRAFGPIKQLGDSDSSYIALQYRHSKCYPLRLHSITIDLYTVTGQDRDGQLNFDHLYSMYMYVFVSNIYI